MARRIGFGDGGGDTEAVRRGPHRGSGMVGFAIAALVLIITILSRSEFNSAGLADILSSATPSWEFNLRDHIDLRLAGIAIPVGAFALILLNAAMQNKARRRDRSSTQIRGRRTSELKAPKVFNQDRSKVSQSAKPRSSPWQRTSAAPAFPNSPVKIKLPESASTSDLNLPLPVRFIGLAILTPLLIGFGLSAFTAVLEALQVFRFAGVGAALPPAFLALFFLLITRALFALFWLMLRGKRPS